MGTRDGRGGGLYPCARTLALGVQQFWGEVALPSSLLLTNPLASGGAPPPPLSPPGCVLLGGNDRIPHTIGGRAPGGAERGGPEGTGGGRLGVGARPRPPPHPRGGRRPGHPGPRPRGPGLVRPFPSVWAEGGGGVPRERPLTRASRASQFDVAIPKGQTRTGPRNQIPCPQFLECFPNEYAFEIVAPGTIL